MQCIHAQASQSAKADTYMCSRTAGVGWLLSPYGGRCSPAVVIHKALASVNECGGEFHGLRAMEKEICTEMLSAAAALFAGGDCW
jgi:hypothetical protein